MRRARGRSREGLTVRLYRINTVEEPGGPPIKKRDVLARNDAEAVQRAEDSEDCPVCDVLRDGNVIGTVA